MRRRLLFTALLFIAGTFGCSQSPVQASAREAQPAADVAPGDTTARGGNVMGSGH